MLECRFPRPRAPSELGTIDRRHLSKVHVGISDTIADLVPGKLVARKSDQSQLALSLLLLVLQPRLQITPVVYIRAGV